MEKEIEKLMNDNKEMHNKMMKMLRDGNNGQSIWLIPEIIDNMKLRKDLVFDKIVYCGDKDDIILSEDE